MGERYPYSSGLAMPVQPFTYYNPELEKTIKTPGATKTRGWRYEKTKQERTNILHS